MLPSGGAENLFLHEPVSSSADALPYVAPGPEKKALKYMKKVRHMDTDLPYGAKSMAKDPLCAVLSPTQNFSPARYLRASEDTG